MDATISSSTLAAANLSAGDQSILAPHQLCSLDLGTLVPKDFLKFVAGRVATPEQTTASRVVFTSEVGGRFVDRA